MMADWRKLRELTRAERVVLIQAMALFPAVKLAQRWSRLDRLHSRLARLFGHEPQPRDDARRGVSANDITRLVGLAARRGLVRPNCLQHSLVLWTLLKRHRFDAAIHFGVRKNNEQTLEAHAWVVVDGRVLNESDQVTNQYRPFERPVVSGQAKSP